MTKFFTVAFWSYAGERALKTAVQALLAGGLIGGGLLGLDWVAIGSLAGGTVLASIATSILMYRGDGSDNPDDTSIGTGLEGSGHV